MGWQYASECRDPKTGDLRLTATSLLALILGNQMTLPEKPTGPNQIVLRSTAPSSSLESLLCGLELRPHEELESVH